MFLLLIHVCPGEWLSHRGDLILPSRRISTIFSCFVMTTLKIYSFNNFQVDNTALLMIVTVLHTKSPKLTHLTAGSGILLSHISPRPLLTPATRPLSISMSSAVFDGMYK